MENSLSIPRTLAEDTATTLAIARQRLIEQLNPGRRPMDDTDIFRAQLDEMRSERKAELELILRHVDDGFRWVDKRFDQVENSIKEIRIDIRAMNARADASAERFHDAMTAMQVRADERSEKFHDTTNAMSEKFHTDMTAMQLRADERSEQFHAALTAMQLRSDEAYRNLHSELIALARHTSDSIQSIQQQMAENARQSRMELDASIGELRADFREMQRNFKWMIGSQFAMMIFFMGAILHLPHVL